MLRKRRAVVLLDWDMLNDETLGHAVDAWLVRLRAHGLSDRRLRDWAGLLGQALRPIDDHAREELRMLARFAPWWRNRAGGAHQVQ